MHKGILVPYHQSSGSGAWEQHILQRMIQKQAYYKTTNMCHPKENQKTIPNCLGVPAFIFK